MGVGLADHRRLGHGGLGVCQIQPTTAAFVSSSILQVPPLDPRAAADNIELCAAYLRYLLNSTGGNASAGPGRLLPGPGVGRRRQGILRRRPRPTSTGILAYASIFAGQG